MPIVTVDLGPRSYHIHIGSGVLGVAGELFREHGLRQKEALIITNPQVAALYFDRLHGSMTAAGFTRVLKHEIPATEQGKNWDELSKTCATLVQEFPDTGSTPLVVLLGGGVVGDLGGFAASLYRRGVPFVQIPTTLLAAVDSSVGGKLAVNFGGVKNILGVIAQPALVVCDLEVLRTLDPRELRSGTAEVIKYGAVCSAELFERLEAGDLQRLLALEPGPLEEIVAVCCRLKADVVERDELDKKGIRNVLNFGHTIGHALELSVEYRLAHGEAVAIGMIAATHLARALGLVGEDFARRLRALIETAGLPTSFPEFPGLFERTVRAMQMDKKFREGRNVFVLPTGPGAWRQTEDIPWETVHAAVRYVLRAE